VTDKYPIMGNQKGIARTVRGDPGNKLHQPFQRDVGRNDSVHDASAFPLSVKWDGIGGHDDVACPLVKIGVAPERLFKFSWDLIPVP